MNRAWMKTTTDAVLLTAPALTALVFLLSAVEVGQAAAPRAAADVDAARIAKGDRDFTKWMCYGRTYDGQRFSPLARISSGSAQTIHCTPDQRSST
jgi:glucose dehydrogenase